MLQRLGTLTEGCTLLSAKRHLGCQSNIDEEVVRSVSTKLFLRPILEQACLAMCPDWLVSQATREEELLGTLSIR